VDRYRSSIRRRLIAAIRKIGEAEGDGRIFRPALVFAARCSDFRRGPPGSSWIPGSACLRRPRRRCRDRGLQREIAAVLADPAVKERYGVLGIEPVGNTPEQFAAQIRKTWRAGKKYQAGGHQARVAHDGHPLRSRARPADRLHAAHARLVSRARYGNPTCGRITRTRLPALEEAARELARGTHHDRGALPAGKGDQAGCATTQPPSSQRLLGDTSVDHDLRIAHVAIDRKHTSMEDSGTWFPLPALRRRNDSGPGATREALSRRADPPQPAAHA